MSLAKWMNAQFKAEYPKRILRIRIHWKGLSQCRINMLQLKIFRIGSEFICRFSHCVDRHSHARWCQAMNHAPSSERRFIADRIKFALNQTANKKEIEATNFGRKRPRCSNHAQGSRAICVCYFEPIIHSFLYDLFAIVAQILIHL